MSTNLRETPLTDRSPLDAVERIFQLVACAPDGLALDGRVLSNKLPTRQIPLMELRDLLTSRALCDATRDVIWRELVIRARGDDRQWAVGAVGVAVPALRRIAGRLCLYLGAQESAGIESEILAAFLAAVRNIDFNRPDILPRLCIAASRAGERARQRAHSNIAQHLSGHSSKEPVLGNAALAGEAESALSLPITSSTPRKVENVPKTSARSRITSDPQPINTSPKGGWGSPTGSARISSLARRCRWRHLSRGALMAAVVAIVLVATAAAVLAESKPPPSPAAVPDSLNVVFGNLRNWLIGLLAALATLMLTVGGLRYLVAGGDPGEVQKAKAALKAAAMGYGLAVLAPLFVNVLKRIVGGG